MQPQHSESVMLNFDLGKIVTTLGEDTIADIGEPLGLSKELSLKAAQSLAENFHGNSDEAIAAVLGQELVQQRGMVVSLPHPALHQRGGPEAVQVTGVPIKLSDTPGAVRSAPPMLAQHTRSALGELLGLPAGRLDDLAARGIIGNFT